MFGRFKTNYEEQLRMKKDRLNNKNGMPNKKRKNIFFVALFVWLSIGAEPAGFVPSRKHA